MNWKNSCGFLLVVLLMVGCNGKKEIDLDALEVTMAREVSSKYLIEADALRQLANEESVKIIDFRKEKAYAESHIDGAINIWRDQLEDHTYPYNGMMATADSVALLLGCLGISDTDQLIVYDDRGSCDAARFWWVMQNFDFDRVKILNGGLKAWMAEGGRVNTRVEVRKPTTFRLPENPSFRYLIDRVAMQKLVINPEDEIIIDTRSRDEYSGKRQKAGAGKGGRIPGSHQIDWTEAVDYHGTLKFKTKDELEKIFGTSIVGKDQPIITYCHTGVRSALTTFVLTQLLGYENVRNYDGSWTEWSFYKEHPFEKDSITTILN
jgi:thiosulfate/3-mercaptopyruvate sulfurtransferase